MPEDVFDVSDLHPTSIGKSFMKSTFSASGIESITLFDMSHWNIKHINDTNATEGFMAGTFSGCIKLHTVYIPDMNWNECETFP
jgi:hypothetical protein